MLCRIAPLLLAASSALAGTCDVTVTDCCDASCKAVIKTLSYPKTCATPGECKASGTGTVNEEVTDANLQLTIQLAGAKILDKTVSACGPIDVSLPLGLGTVHVAAIAACPMAAGDITVSIDINNKIALPGKILAHAVAKDQASATLLCLDITFTPEAAVAANATKH